jgi:type IV pilus assembly protein PilC
MARTSTQSREADGLFTFRYEAISPTGTRIKGSKARMVAYSADAVRRELLDQGFIPIEISQVASSGVGSSLTGLLQRTPKMTIAQMAAFARQLHELLRAGISAPKALLSLAEQAPTPRLQQVCNDVATRVSSGSSLADAFSAFPRTFDKVFVSYVSAGERTGSIVESTARLATMYERKAKMRSKVLAVAMYPMLISIIIGIIVIGILVFLVPRFAAIYASFNAELPGPTLALLAFSKKIPLYSAVTVATVVSVNVLFRKAVAKNPDLGIKFDKLRFKLPVVGKLFHRLALFRWATTLAGALEAGLPLTAALDLSASSAGSLWVKAITIRFVEGIESGKPLSAMLGDVGWFFPPSVRTMITTGEASGELPRMLESSAETLDSEIDAMVATMGAKLEVALLLFMAVTVGALLIILYLPIISLASSVGDSVKR